MNAKATILTGGTMLYLLSWVLLLGTGSGIGPCTPVGPFWALMIPLVFVGAAIGDALGIDTFAFQVVVSALITIPIYGVGVLICRALFRVATGMPSHKEQKIIAERKSERKSATNTDMSDD